MDSQTPATAPLMSAFWGEANIP